MKPFAQASERNGSRSSGFAAFFTQALPHLTWLASDVREHLAGILAWGLEAIELDVDKPWPPVNADAAFSANTAHITCWQQVERIARFDAMLRSRDPASGVQKTL